MRHTFWIVLLGLALLPLQSAAQGNAPAQSDPLADALQQSDVFVGKTMRDKVDTAPLTALTEAHKNTDRPLKIGIMSQLPASGQQFGTRDNYTKELHRYLGLNRGTLILVTANGVSASTNSLTPAQIIPLVKQNSELIKTDATHGVSQLVADLDAEATRSGSTPGVPSNAPQPMSGTVGAPAPAQPGGDSSSFLWILPVGIGVALAAWGISRASAKRRAMQEAEIPVRRLYGEVVEGISYADTYLDLLPPSQEREAALQQRQNAAELLEQAKGFARYARTPQDFGRAQALLEQAKVSTNACRQRIDVATGGTGFAVALEGTDYRVTPAIGASQASPVVSGLRAEDIPPAERGACFFCSRPERISRMTPLTIALNGQRRKVLSCGDCVQTVERGATPEVRTVMSGGQRVPWYSSRSYDPYRDYTHSEAYYVPSYYGYGPGDGGFMTGFLFGAMLSDPYPMMYPVFVASSGDLTNDFQAADAVQPIDSGGSSDFFGDNSSYSHSGDSVGGADFGNGGSDWSSPGDSSDFGSSDTGSDFGGGDFGGGDFGGGDSGGGGGDF